MAGAAWSRCSIRCSLVPPGRPWSSTTTVWVRPCRDCSRTTGGAGKVYNPKRQRGLFTQGPDRRERAIIASDAQVEEFVGCGKLHHAALIFRLSGWIRQQERRVRTVRHGKRIGRDHLTLL